MAVKLQPLGIMVIFRPKKAKDKSKGGLILPDVAKEKPQEGVVVAVGPGRPTETGKREPLDVKVGDTIIYPPFGGQELKIDGEELIIMPENSIWAKRIKK
jgi:chaperonin GroES